jgi:hypothetical protein
VQLSYDDVPTDPSNPFPGKLFNRPTAAGDPGKDVREGCKIDYRGDKVTAQTFLAVLTGDAKTAQGPVLKSTENDHVFINFVGERERTGGSQVVALSLLVRADHGGTGILAFPAGPYLTVRLSRQVASTVACMDGTG